MQAFFCAGIPFTLIDFVLVIVEKLIDLLLLAEADQKIDAGREIITLMKVKRNAPLREGGLQHIQTLMNKCDLAGRHLMLLPLPGRCDKQRNHPGIGLGAGRVQRQIIVNTQVVSQPD